MCIRDRNDASILAICIGLTSHKEILLQPEELHKLLLEISLLIDLRKRRELHNLISLRNRILRVELIEILVEVLDECFQFWNCGRHVHWSLIGSLVLGRGTLIHLRLVGRLSWLLILRLIVHLRRLVLIGRLSIGRGCLLLSCSILAGGRLLRLSIRVAEGKSLTLQ